MSDYSTNFSRCSLLWKATAPNDSRLTPIDFSMCCTVDADHSYEGVVKVAAVAVHKVKPNGLLVFNDYIVMDEFSKLRYGVVPAVNELVTQSDWKVVGFALEQRMFCDIALRRA
jgi:hypothetical protein